MSEITRSLIPAAGHGTRLSPLTRAIPKEMLPLGRKPVLEYIVEELVACGIRDVLIVVSPGKESIEAYFQDGAAFGVRISYVIQREMRGLGDAVLHGEQWADGSPFLAAFGDCLLDSADHEATRRLLQIHSTQGAFASVLTQEVGLDLVSRYGIVAPIAAPEAGSGSPFRFGRIVEKPSSADAPSRFAVAARWALDSGIFAHIRETPPGPGGELGLSQAVDRALLNGKTGWAVPLTPGEGRIDVGSWDSYLAAAADAIVRDEELGSGILESLCGRQPC